jgi:hypothetical protein
VNNFLDEKYAAIQMATPPWILFFISVHAGCLEQLEMLVDVTCRGLKKTGESTVRWSTMSAL